MPNRVEIWIETKNKYKTQSVVKSEKYTDIPKIINHPSYSNSCVYNLHMDMIDAAIFYKRLGYNPLLLNMTDWSKPGGAVNFGSNAKEEECFRRSNYYKHLTEEYYPMKKIDSVYSSNVEYYRSGSNHNYSVFEESVNLDMISSPAVKHPRLTDDCLRFGIKSDIILMREKIKMLLTIGVINNHDIIVLSSWGCPTTHMAELFRSVIETEFPNSFKCIVFAITDVKIYNIYNDVFKKI